MSSKIKIWLAITIFFISNFSFAQDQPAIAKPMSDLLKLEGKWEGPAKLKINGKSYEFSYYADFLKTADGSGLYMQEWFNAPGLGNLKGSNLIGYNANDSKIHWFSVDNFGTAHDHIGIWKSGNHFFMQANEIQGKKKFVEKIDLTLRDNDTMEFLLIATIDGKETENGIATFHRSK